MTTASVTDIGDARPDLLRRDFINDHGRESWDRIQSLFGPSAAKDVFVEGYQEIGGKMLGEYGRLYAKAFMSGDLHVCLVCLDVLSGPDGPKSEAAEAL